MLTRLLAGFVSDSGVTATLTGQQVTAAQGSLSPAVTVALTGQGIAISQGAVTTSVGVTAALTGQSTTASQGGVLAAVVTAVTGQSISAAQGIVSTAALFNPADRGTIDLSNSSITPNGSTPQINIKNRYIGDANTTGARFTYGRLTGVNGMTPVIKVDRSNMEISASAQFLWSTTGLKGSWTPFANFTSDASFFTVSHNVAFTSDTIYFASNNPWPVGYTLPWIQSLEASGFVSPAPSGAGSYQFETRSATTNGATAGVGDVIAAQPLYSFKISSGAGNAPDGFPKRSLVLMAGTHAAEDVGNYALEGAVAFLTSADAQAVTVRNWFNVYVYPLTATAGRAGGGQRNDFENTLKTTDVNREWPNATLETVNKHKTAIQTDAGSTLAMLLDFHGTHLSNEGAYDWYNGLSQARWTTAIRTYWAALEIRSNGTAGLASKWSVDSKSANHGVSPEYPYHNNEVMASLLSYGESHMRAVAYLADAGEWATYALTGQSVSVTRGTVSPVVSVALTGQVSTLATGTVTASAGGVTAALTGQSTTASQGAVIPAVAVSITGQSAALAQGAVTALSGVVAALTGQQTSVTQGLLTGGTAVAVTGQQVSVTQGAVVGGVARALTGQQVSVTQGAMASAAVVALTGNSIVLTQGVVTRPTNATLTTDDLAAIDALIVGRLGDIAAAILAAAQVAPIHSDTRKMNGAVVQGTGAAGDLWRGA
jgi:hypothetical protein